MSCFVGNVGKKGGLNKKDDISVSAILILILLICDAI